MPTLQRSQPDPRMPLATTGARAARPDALVNTAPGGAALAASLGPDGCPTSDEDREACRTMIKGGSLTFHAASLFLPTERRDPCYALYAFCRMADDAVDDQPTAEGRHAACAELRDRLDRAYAGRPLDTPVDRAFSDMVLAYGLPKALPEALIEGMEWDAEGRIYESLSDLRSYAARVAAVVGVMMTHLMGVRDPVVLARACDLGTAMQLTNICRDVGEDARLGRIYLPRQWMRDEGLDPEAWLADPRFCPPLSRVVARLLREADALYERAMTGIVGLPLPCRPAIQAAGVLYAAIGDEVIKAGYDSVSRRAVVSAKRKASLAARAMSASLLPRRIDGAPCLFENQFLVDAVVNAPLSQAERRRIAEEAAELARRARRPIKRTEAPLPMPADVPWWHLGTRTAWALDVMVNMTARELEEESERMANALLAEPQAT